MNMDCQNSGSYESDGIHVKLDGIKYPMIILRKDEFLYREAAKMVNEKLNLYRLNYKDAGSIQHWTMTAFELAYIHQKTDKHGWMSVWKMKRYGLRPIGWLNFSTVTRKP